MILQKITDILVLASERKKEEEKLLKGLLVSAHISFLSGQEFREWCAAFLTKSGYENVRLSEGAGGIDITCTLNNKKIYVVCVNKLQFHIEAGRILKKLAGAMIATRTEEGILITTGSINEADVSFISLLYPEVKIRVIDKNALEFEYDSLYKYGAFL
jgi:HJR/Mrr/RecB family endonuclease